MPNFFTIIQCYTEYPTIMKCNTKFQLGLSCNVHNTNFQLSWNVASNSNYHEMLHEISIIVQSNHLLTLLQTEKVMHMLVLVVVGALLSVPSEGVNEHHCHDLLCASVVSKCALTEACTCEINREASECSCCHNCIKCLGEHYQRCCSCVGESV